MKSRHSDFQHEEIDTIRLGKPGSTLNEKGSGSDDPGAQMK